MKSGGTPVSGHISFMTRSCKWRILEAFKIFFPMPFLSTVSITEENYMPRKLKYSCSKTEFLQKQNITHTTTL
jgi:hypothetical protein